MPYGLGVWVMDDHGWKTIQHGGGAPGFSTQTIYYPEHGLMIVVLANFGGFDAPGFSRKIAGVCLGDTPAPAPAANSPEPTRAPVSLAAEQLETKAGIFQQIGSEQFVRLFVRDQTLRWARGIGTRGNLEMIPLAEDRFVIPGVVPLSFKFSADGRECETTSPAQARGNFSAWNRFRLRAHRCENTSAITPARSSM
jgi:hypothetical protein